MTCALLPDEIDGIAKFSNPLAPLSLIIMDIGGYHHLENSIDKFGKIFLGMVGAGKVLYLSPLLTGLIQQLGSELWSSVRYRIHWCSPPREDVFDFEDISYLRGLCGSHRRQFYPLLSTPPVGTNS